MFVSRATFGMRFEWQSKRLRVQIIAFAFAAVVAVDCRDRGIELLIVNLFVLGVLVAMSLALIRDRARKVELARRRTIEPTDCGRRSSPDDVATAEVVPEGKGKDEQEESNHYMGGYVVSLIDFGSASWVHSRSIMLRKAKAWRTR